MNGITNQDLLWIVQAALQVAASDKQLLDSEEDLLHPLIRRSGLSLEEDKMIRAAIARGDRVPLHFLSSGKARQLCQLVIAAVALTGPTLTECEREMNDEFSHAMGLDPLPLQPKMKPQYTRAIHRFLDAG